MQILERRTYRGPNLYAHFPVIRLNLDLGELEHHPSATIPGFVDALMAAIPSLQSHTCSYGEEGGFIRRMREQEGTWLGHVLDSARRPRLISLTRSGRRDRKPPARASLRPDRVFFHTYNSGHLVIDIGRRRR